MIFTKGLLAIAPFCMILLLKKRIDLSIHGQEFDKFAVWGLLFLALHMCKRRWIRPLIKLHSFKFSGFVML